MPPNKNCDNDTKQHKSFLSSVIPSVGFSISSTSRHDKGGDEHSKKKRLQMKKNKLGQDLVDSLNNEFNRLSPEEQDRAYKNLYGIDNGNNNCDSQACRSCTNSTENISSNTISTSCSCCNNDNHNADDHIYVREKLIEFQHAIQSISKKDAYNRALQECSDYVTDEQYQLMFLRSSDYDAKVAAKKMVQHWKIKLQLFGPELTFGNTGDSKRQQYGRIQLSDLNKDDIHALKSGGFRFLQGIDKAGRGITWGRHSDFFNRKTNDNALRAVWYILTEASYDTNVQKNGIIHISYNSDVFSLTKFDRSLMKQIVHMATKAMPLRYVGSHICFNDFKFKIIVPFILMFMGPKQRAQCRLHTESSADIALDLCNNFGIPLNVMPTDLEGSVDSKSHLDWINERMAKEEEEEEGSTRNREFIEE